jgi:hypothetical protein
MNGLMPPSAMIVLLTKAERLLLLHHGLRLQVDRITANGRYALCTAQQVERKFLRSPLHPDLIVHRCHEALSPLYAIGSEPLIKTLPIADGKHHPAMDANDPFRLLSAWRSAGLASLLAPGFLIPQRSRQNGVVIGQR